MRTSKLGFLLGSIAVLVLFTTCLGATVTAGYIRAIHSGPGTFSLSGSDFTAQGNFYPDGGVWMALGGCRGCAPGTSLSVYGKQFGNDFADGSATIGGIYFPHVSWGDPNAERASVFEINGPDIVLGNGAGTYRGTFFFAGGLCGTDPNVHEYPNPCIATLGLDGTGIVSVDVSEAIGLLWVDQVTYTFATPEPGTLALLGTTVLGFAATLRRRLLK